MPSIAPLPRHRHHTLPPTPTQQGVTEPPPLESAIFPGLRGQGLTHGRLGVGFVYCDEKKKRTTELR